MKEHKEFVHQGKQFYCSKCSKSFRSQKSLKRHLELHDIRDQGLKFSCEECKRTYQTRSSFGIHLNYFHDGKRIKPCMILDETTTQNSVKSVIKKVNLDDHTRKKSSENFEEGKLITKLENKTKKNTQCPECERQFCFPSEVKKHVKEVHEGVRQNCEECHKSFSTKFDLKYHVNAIHRGQTFKCDICMMSFESRNGRFQHVSSVHLGACGSRSLKLNEAVSKQDGKQTPNLEKSQDQDTRRILRKPLKGTWIVKLQKINIP